MRFEETPIPGAFLVHLEPVEDERGFFARLFDRSEFERHGLVTDFDHLAFSFNRLRGTLRGLHLQAPPFAEAKLVRCTRGAIYDVLVDLRPESRRCSGWFATTLAADDPIALYVPAGVAHGFLTLTDAAEVSYCISAPYSAEHARGVRWDDPAFAVEWPEPPRVISERDTSYPDFAGG